MLKEVTTAEKRRCHAAQVCKALRDGVHPIALREFRYSLTKEEEEELVELVELKMRCSDPHIVKPLGALQSRDAAAARLLISYRC